jgi:hypothetical protein
MLFGTLRNSREAINVLGSPVAFAQYKEVSRIARA